MVWCVHGRLWHWRETPWRPPSLSFAPSRSIYSAVLRSAAPVAVNRRAVARSDARAVEFSFHGRAARALPAISSVSSPGMSSSGSGSSSRKEFDVKQILRIRWRWFGHPAVPPPHSPPLGDYFAGRRTGGSTGDGPSVSGCGNSNPTSVNPGSHSGLVASGSAGSNLCNGSGRKFVDPAGSRGGPGGAGATGSSCPRSVSQPECRSSAAALPWVSPPPRRRSRPVTNMELPGEAPVPQLVPESPAHLFVEEEAAAAAASGTEENNNPPETDSSSCR